MKSNIGKPEQLIRIVGGVVLLVMGFLAWQYIFWPGIIIAAIGTLALVTGAFGFSLIYQLFRINTAKRKEASMAQDPVCGMTVDEKNAKATSQYEGTTYYFCAVACKKAFDANPQKYLKKGG